MRRLVRNRAVQPDEVRLTRRQQEHRLAGDARVRLERVARRIVALNVVDGSAAQSEEATELVAQGLSNREISQRLFLSLNTVKGHNRNIFGKLGVNRRTEAVARARELGLLKLE